MKSPQDSAAAVTRPPRAPVFAAGRCPCNAAYWPPSGQPGGPLDALMTVGAAIELIAGFLVMIGFFSSIAAFIASGEMAVAYFMVHQAMGPLPIVNKGESAVLFCFAFLYIAARGSGVWSVDSLMRGAGASAVVT